MINFSDDSTIIACSSGNSSNTAISLVRLSGFDYFNELNDFFSINLNSLEPKKLYLANIVNQSKVVDQITLAFFKAPHSYNGEDILELYVHGNILNVNNIIELFTSQTSVRASYPGEFSYRAFKNGKLTLSQVEGLDLFLNAKSFYELEQGNSLLDGELFNIYQRLYQSYVGHKSAIELSIDFLEDVGEEKGNKEISDSLNRLLGIVDTLHFRSNQSTAVLKPAVVLLGKPNAGKSTLFNKIIRKNRSIISEAPGTTRDYISEDFFFKDVLFSLVDSAGIRNASDTIEKEGVDKTISLASNAFFNILVINPFDFDNEDFESFKEFRIDLILFSHADLENFDDTLAKHVDFLSNKATYLAHLKNDSGSIGASLNILSGPMGADKSGPIGPLSLEDLIHNHFLGLTNSEPIILERHRAVINKIYLLLLNYKELVSSESDIAIISSELNSIGHCISELIGIVSPDDVLQNIFSNFCIGK
jgi:tRNA modification GTPase